MGDKSKEIIGVGGYSVNAYFTTQVVKTITNIGSMSIFEPVCTCNGNDAKETAIEIVKALEFYKSNMLN